MVGPRWRNHLQHLFKPIRVNLGSSLNDVIHSMLVSHHKVFTKSRKRFNHIRNFIVSGKATYVLHNIFVVIRVSLCAVFSATAIIIVITVIVVGGVVWIVLFNSTQFQSRATYSAPLRELTAGITTNVLQFFLFKIRWRFSQRVRQIATGSRRIICPRFLSSRNVNFRTFILY